MQLCLDSLTVNDTEPVDLIRAAKSAGGGLVRAPLSRRWDFPLVELLSRAPTDACWGIETPSRRRAESGMSAQSLAREAISAMRRTIDKISAAKKST
jgi:hypothetical protein